MITQPKLALLPAGKANKSGGGLLGQGITTVTAKLADRADGRLVSQRIIFPQAEFWLLLYRGGGGAYCNADQWLRRTANGHSLVAFLGEGLTAMMISG